MLASLVALVACALIGWSFYLLRMNDLLRQVLPAPALHDKVLFASYCLAVLMSIFLLLFAGLSALARWPQLRRLALALIAAALLCALYLDDRLLQVLGLHLYSPSVLALIGRPGANGTVHMSFGEGTLIACVILILAYLLLKLQHLCEHLLLRSPPRRRARLLGGLLAACLIADGAGWLAARRLVRDPQALAEILPLHELLFAAPRRLADLNVYYPKVAGATPALGRRPNILMIVVETLRADMLSADMMPQLSRFQEAQGCDRSLYHHSSSHVTDFSFFSILFGLHSYHYWYFSKHQVPSFPLQVLKNNGYVVAGASSADLRGWGDLSFVVSQFDSFWQAPGADPTERDAALLRFGQRWLRDRDPQRPYFLLLFFDATHHKYYYPPAQERFRPALPEDYNMVTGDEKDPEVRRRFVNRYKNSVGYVDGLLGQLLAPFRQPAEAGHTLILLTGDHGEEFWDQGLLGHVAVNFVNARTQVPLLLCTPEQRRRELPLSSHVDLMPTVLDYAGIAIDPALREGYTNGVSLLGEQDPERLILIGALGFPLTSRKLCLVSRQRKYWLEKSPIGRQDFTLTRTTDRDDRPAAPIPEELERGLRDLRARYDQFFRP